MAAATVTPLHRAAFLDAMAATVAGVHVLTTAGPGGVAGLTVSSVTSVSADPPLLLACIRTGSPVLQVVRENGAFALSTLAAGQADVADAFAGRPRRGAAYDFAAADWTPGTTGAPLLVGAVARFECRLVDDPVAGTHAILLGSVLAAEHDHGVALAYTRRGYAAPRSVAA
jgi:flavin reductase (DIM6/NTAB) family NADH-FMN oxidoreductase RutF